VDEEIALLNKPEGSDLADEETALTMASTARYAARSDIGVGVGAIAVPGDSTLRRPYGVVHVAVNLRGRTTVRCLSFNGDRVCVREWAADAALALVRLWVLGRS